MKGMNEPRGPEWLESALAAWASAQPPSEARLDAIGEAVTVETTPELSFAWWRAIFPNLRNPRIA